MLETPHVAVAVAIATKIPNPLLSIPLSLASHFILDMTPHWNPHINREVKEHGYPTKKSINIIRADSAIALVLGTAIALHSLPNTGQFVNIMACSFVSVLPDLVEAPYYFLHKKYTVIERLIKWQKSIQYDVSPILGLSTQGVTIAAALLWALAR